MALTVFLFLAGCGFFEDKPEEVYYVRETITSHCFKVWETKTEIRSEWIDCHSIPRKAEIRDVQEWEEQD
jgi:hypothetical protein